MVQKSTTVTALAFSSEGRIMAEIIYPKGIPCMVVEPDKIMTDEERGITFEPVKLDPDSIEQLERIVIRVTMFDYNCPDIWRKQQDITTIQAKEIGKWLCK